MTCVSARFLTQRTTGIERYAFALSRELTRLGREFTFLTPRRPLLRRPGGRLAPTGVTHGVVWDQVDQFLYLKTHGNPLLLVLAGSPPVLYANQVVYVYDLAFLRRPEWFSRRYHRYYRFVYRRTLHRARHVVTISEFSKAEILDCFRLPADRVSVVYGAHDHVVPGGDDAADPGGAGRAADPPYIVAVSSLDPRKNLAGLLAAFHRLGRRDLRLKIVGAANRVFDMPSLPLDAPNVEYLGYVGDRELRRLYRHAAALVYPSLYEGFGLPPLEAMACGCPVIVSAAGSLPEVCGDGAVYFDPTRPDEMAERIEAVVTGQVVVDPAAVQATLARYSWAKSAQRLLRVLDGLGGTGGPADRVTGG